MSDVLDGAVSPGVANATVNAGGKLLKSVELQMKYGVNLRGKRVLNLVGDGPVIDGVAHESNGHAKLAKS